MRRRESLPEKIAFDMTPMIDVVFQLLVFFLLTMKPIVTEGEIAITVSQNTAGSTAKADKIDITEKIQITLVSSIDGKLANIKLGQNDLGPQPASLTKQLRDSHVGPQGSASDVEVEIAADSKLRYNYLMRTVNAVLQAGIEKINLADKKSR